MAETFVELSDTLSREFEVASFLHLFTTRCVELLGVPASGLILIDPQGRNHLTAASSEQARALQSVQISDGNGPSVDSFRRVEEIGFPELSAVAGRWPRFVAAAGQAGFTSMYVTPMHWRGETIGVLNLFWQHPGPLPEATARLVRPMGDIATIALLRQRSVRNQVELTSQLQSALDSRVAVEQAKGMLAERLDMDLDGAFITMRAFARSHNLKLAALASGLIADRSRLAEVQRWAAG